VRAPARNLYCDVLIGAGIAGLTALDKLSDQGVHVAWVVLDRLPMDLVHAEAFDLTLAIRNAERANDNTRLGCLSEIARTRRGRSWSIKSLA
jgi:hypothetical protein